MPSDDAELIEAVARYVNDRIYGDPSFDGPARKYAMQDARKIAKAMLDIASPIITKQAHAQGRREGLEEAAKRIEQDGFARPGEGCVIIGRDATSAAAHEIRTLIKNTDSGDGQ